MPQQYTEDHAESMNWPILAAIKPSAELAQVALDRPVCIVGARVRVSLPLPCEHTSKVHALMVQEAGGVYLRDLESLNKTFVNRRPVRETWLLNRDIVQFGRMAFVCRSGFGQPSERPSAPACELWVVAGGGASTQVFPLGQETFVIGSRSGCDLLLDADDVACAHAVIYVREGRRYFRDLSPFGHTLFEGRSERDIELRGEERVQIGQSRLEFHAAAAEVSFMEEFADVLTRPDADRHFRGKTSGVPHEHDESHVEMADHFEGRSEPAVHFEDESVLA